MLLFAFIPFIALGAFAQDAPKTPVEAMATPVTHQELVALQRPPVTIASDAIRGFGTYAYDGSGNITSVGDGTGADSFVYDRLGRLEGATLRGEPCSNMPAAPCRTEKYTYDRFGNIVSIATAGNPPSTIFTNADDDTNRITAPGVVYDSRGNLTAYLSRQFTYDALDMMTSSDIEGIRRVYVYSATDERVVTVGKVGSTFTGSDWTIRDAGGRVLRRLARSASGTFTWTEDSVYRGGQLLSAAVPGPEKVRNFHLDHLGTPRLITGNGGAQIAEHHYRPYGVETPSSTWDGEKAKFTGHERDTATLDYMLARYYDPYLGRFLSADPGKDWDLQQPQSWNLYSYTRNNPVANVDEDGEELTYFVMSLARKTYRKVTRAIAVRTAAKGARHGVKVVGKGSSKEAKNIVREAFPDQVLLRHDPHPLEHLERGDPERLPHWQPKGKGLDGQVGYDVTMFLLGFLPVIGVAMDADATEISDANPILERRAKALFGRSYHELNADERKAVFESLKEPEPPPKRQITDIPTGHG